MREYIVTLLVYLFSYPLAHYLTGDTTASLMFKLIAVSACLYHFRKSFRFRISWNWLAVLIGVVVFIQWVAFGDFVLGETDSVPFSFVDMTLKLLIGVALAPVVEEFFTRFFLIRYLIDKDWKKVKLGTYTNASFIITVIFFSLSHSRWLAGLFAGILFNLLLYRTRKIEHCVLAHAVANLLLGIYVIYTGSWQFW